MSDNVSGDVKETTESHDVEQVESSPTEDQTNDSNESNSSTTEPQKISGVQKRINELTRQKYEERMRAEELERKLKELEATTKAQVPELKEPKEDDYDDYEEYQQAYNRYVADNAVEKAYQRLSETQKAESERKKQEEVVASLQAKQQSFLSNLENKRNNFQDFDEVAYGHKFVDQSLAEMIFDSEKGPEIAYHLGSNLDEAERIFNLTPLQRMREITRLELKLGSVAPKKISSAPDPIKPLGGSDKVEKDPDKMTTDEWLAWRRANLKY